MTFEEKLSQIYNEIANETSGMIPVEWEKVYTIAYVDDEGGGVVSNYTKPGSEDLNYYSDIPKNCNVSKDIFKNSWFKVYRIFNELRETFKREDLGPWTSRESDLTRGGNLEISFDYIDWVKSGFGPSGKENYYMYKKFGILPDMEYEMEEIQAVEKYVKGQE